MKREISINFLRMYSCIPNHNTKSEITDQAE